jgi:diadenosine tetraphosphatase ApaH/serine/threonine PP2A family protein phosphatase
MRYDIIGDIHGCYNELIQLLEKLGYREDPYGFYTHPEGRIFGSVGDLVDRGPNSIKVLQFFKKHLRRQYAFAVRGNHDDKFLRYLKGNQVKIAHGLQNTIDELHAMELPEEELRGLMQFLDSLPHWITLEDGGLLICHAAPPVKGKKEKFNKQRAIYGVTTGNRDAQGFPERIDWAPEYDESDSELFVVYGHVTVPQAYILNKSANIDTACVFGGSLTAMRWPEREFVSVESSYNCRQGVGEPITTLNLAELMDYFKKNEEEVLAQIDNDPLINRKTCKDTGNVIANKSKDLTREVFMHQLFAVGIEYSRFPYRLISIPSLASSGG